MNKSESTNDSGFSLVSGGLIYSITSPLRKGKTADKARYHMAFFLVILTWGILGILAFSANAIEDTELTISFLEDIMIHVRYLFVIPFLILIEKVAESAFLGYVKTSEKIIQISEQPRFNKLVENLNKLTDSFIPEIVMLITVYTYVALNWDSLEQFTSERNYLSNAGELNAAGWYYLLVCSPIFQLLVFRWLWRWAVWVFSVFKISKFNLKMDSLHADKMGGLEYINIVPLALSFLLIAPSAVFSAHIACEIIYKGAELSQFIFSIGAYVFLLPLILYAPLLLFITKLIKTKTYGIINFGNTIRKHNMAYNDTWITEKDKKIEPLLGSMDNSSLADINGSYASVQASQLLPINLKMLILSFVMNLLPYLPLIFTYYTPSELFQDFLKSLL